MIDFTGAVAIFVAILAHCATLGATTSAHRASALPVDCVSGFAYFPAVDIPLSASTGTAISPSHRACSCTCSFPHKNFAVTDEISPDFCHTYHIAFCTGSNHVAPQNTALEKGIAPVATQNHACTLHLPACNSHWATSCPDCADAIVPIPVPRCSAPPVTIHGADTNVDQIPHNTLAHCHKILCLESTYD